MWVDHTGAFCPHGHHVQDPEPCPECWTEPQRAPDPYSWGLQPWQADILRRAMEDPQSVRVIWGTPRQYGLSEQLAAALEVAKDMEESLAKVQAAVDHGASMAALTALAEAHAQLAADAGAPPSRFTTLTQVPSLPVVPHLKEKSVSVTATPAQRREAWLSLMSDMERSLLSTRESARTQTGRPNWGQPALGEWDATAWAAGQLLEALRKLQAPEVPVDDTLGQGDLLTLVDAPLSPRCLHGQPVGWTCPDGCQGPARPPSTPGENPGDDPCACLGAEHPHAPGEKHGCIWKPQRPRRLIDCTGDRWEELEDGRWAYVPEGAEGKVAGQDPYDRTGRPFGPIFTLEGLTRLYAPLREPEGDQYDLGAESLEQDD